MPAPADCVRLTLKKSPRRCFDAFTDPRFLVAWVPELRRAVTVERDADGRPLHVKFELGESLSYSILYSYDLARLRIDFRPGVGAREAVTGFAEFAEHPDGCEMIYAVATGPGRGAEASAAGDPAVLAASFARWVDATP